MKWMTLLSAADTAEAVSFKIDFEVLLCIYKALNFLAPPYNRDFLLFRPSVRAQSLSITFLSNVPCVSHKITRENAFCFFSHKYLQ